jgi:hypothetical protein
MTAPEPEKRDDGPGPMCIDGRPPQLAASSLAYRGRLRHGDHPMSKVPQDERLGFRWAKTFPWWGAGKAPKAATRRIGEVAAPLTL